jgi:hypothetical protein
MSRTLKVSNGDWFFDSRGRALYITGREKCAQDVANVQLQDLYPDGSWGSELNRMEKGAIVDAMNAHKTLIQVLVTESIERLQAFQEQEEAIPNDEKIQNISVAVDRMTNEPLSYVYFLAVETSAKDEPLNQVYAIELQQVADPNLLNY